jgi:prepilin signal peptidase PulO-like enzyme (type II secretory pathway)
LSLLQSLAGAGVGFVILFLLAIIIPGGMGMGDVKLGAYIGLIVGFPLIALALIAAFVLGGAVAGSLWAAGVLSRGDRIAFGPYLAAAGLVGLLFGTDLVTLWTSRLA